MPVRRFSTILIACVSLVSLSAATNVALGKPARAAQSDELVPDRIDKLVKAGWKLPPPPYPEMARFRSMQGKIYMGMSTDPKGHLLKATILRVDKSANSGSLRSMVLLWAWYHWSGPPNSLATVLFEFRLR